MSRTIATVSAALLVAVTGAWTPASPVDLDSVSRIWVDGTSTVRGFTCKAQVLTAQIEGGSTAFAKAILGGEKVVRGVRLTVPSAKLDCGNGTMNDHMMKAMKTKEHADITWTLDSYELNGAVATLNGTLQMGGTEKAISFPVELKDGPDGALKVTGTYELNMRDYGLTPPSLMFGTMKVGEKVKVGFELVLKD